jgi:hypothetical protein
MTWCTVRTFVMRCRFRYRLAGWCCSFDVLILRYLDIEMESFGRSLKKLNVGRHRRRDVVLWSRCISSFRKEFKVIFWTLQEWCSPFAHCFNWFEIHASTCSQHVVRIKKSKIIANRRNGWRMTKFLRHICSDSRRHSHFYHDVLVKGTVVPLSVMVFKPDVIMGMAERFCFMNQNNAKWTLARSHLRLVHDIIMCSTFSRFLLERKRV